MLSTNETIIKSENSELPLNLKTHESANFTSIAHPRSPSLGHVSEHLLKAVNNISSSPASSENNMNMENNGNASVAESNLANSVLNSISTSNMMINNSIANSMSLLGSNSSSHTAHDALSIMKPPTTTQLSPNSFSSSRSGYIPRENLTMNHLSNINNLNNIMSIATSTAVSHSNSPALNAYNNAVSNATASPTNPINNVPTSCSTSSTGYMDHNQHAVTLPYTSVCGFQRSSTPPLHNQITNHVTNHVTSLPTSIGRLPLGITSRYSQSPIQEPEEVQSPVSSGGGVSPSISPVRNASPTPTLVPISDSERIDRDRPRSVSPACGSISSLQHALQGLQGLHSLHNLHNLHNLQNLQTQMAALAGLQGSANVPAVSSLLHSRLETQRHQPTMPVEPPPPLNSPLPNNLGNNIGSSNNINGSSNDGSVPQMVLTSGQVLQGVQGAQLLIPTSQGIAVRPILTIPLGQAGSISTNSLLGNPLHHFSAPQPQPVPQTHNLHHQRMHAESAVPSPIPTSSASPSSSAGHPLLGCLPPSLFHHGTHNNNNNNSTNNNNIGNHEKTKLPSPLTSPVQDQLCSLSARLGGNHYSHHHAPQQSRYSPEFLDSHSQQTINQATSNVVDGVNLDEIKEFAKAFKIRRLSLGLTQTQVGQALSIAEGPAYSQSAICRFEKLDITPKSAQKIKPVLEHWMLEAEDRYKNGQHTLTDYMGNEPSKKRKRRTSFTPQALEILNAHFERNTHPSGAEITAMGEQLGYEREVVRIWFCNKRQALKNTVRMMANGQSLNPKPDNAALSW